MDLLDWMAEALPLRRRLEGVEDRREELLAWPPVAAVLALQQEDGGFLADGKRPTSMATVAALLQLERCGLDARDAPIRRALAFLRGRHLLDGAFSTSTGGSGILPCYVGQFAALAARLAGPDEPMVRGCVDWLNAWQRYDHRELRGGGGGEAWAFRAPHNYGCWKSVSCYHGVVGGLSGLAAIPAAARTELDRERLGACLAWLEAHRAVFKSGADQPLFRHLLQFFLFGGYRLHALDVLEALSHADPALGRAPWVQPALEAVEARCPGGRVPLLKDYPTHALGLAPLEVPGTDSRFLSWQRWTTRRRFGLEA